MNNIMEQLHDTESEVLSLRAQLEHVTVQADSIVPPALPSEREAVTPSTEDLSMSKRKVRPGRKKKAKGSIERELRSTASTTVSSTNILQVPSKQFSDFAAQTDETGPSVGTSEESGKLDVLVRRPASSPTLLEIETQTAFLVVSTAVQASEEAVSVESQTCHVWSPVPPLTVDSCSIAVQVISPRSHFDFLPDSEQTCPIVGSDDHRSQVSDISEASSYSRQLEELIHQLSEEMKGYEHAVNEMVSIAVTHVPPTTQTDNGLEMQSPVNERVTSGDLCDPSQIAHKLSLLQASLKSRRARLAALRKARRRKPNSSGETTQSSKGSTTSVHSDEVLVTSTAVPSFEPSAPADVNDVTESEVDGWQEDDFPEFDSHPSEVEASCVARKSGSYDSRGDDKNVQTLHRSESCETVVCDLRKTILELEGRLQEESLVYQHRVEQLEASLEPARRLEKSLQQVTDQLVACLPPPPVPPNHMVHSAGLSCSTWPPSDPESQLSFLVAAEAAARSEVDTINMTLINAQETIAKLTTEIEELKKVEPFAPCPPVTTLSDEPCFLAYQLCSILDEEYCQANWDADQWDAILYEMLKPRFTENTESTEEEPTHERIVQLSAEVAALRDILDQHNAFRSQAEHDLRQLWTTVSTQREQIHFLQTEKERLETDLANASGSVNMRQNESDDLSRTAIQQLSELVRSKEEEVEVLRRRCDDLKELIRSAYRRLESADESAVDNVSEAGDDDVVQVVERLTNNWSDAKCRADRVEALYESAVSALQQKHAESQSYHKELQRVYAELSSTQDKYEALKREDDRLREAFSELQTEVLHLKDQEARVCAPELNTSNSQKEEHATSSAAAPDGESNFQSCSVVTSSEPNEAKLLSEITRLQAHLLEMEESYTTEALNAEAREVDLRNRLQEAETRLQQLEESSQTVEDRVQRYMAERDEARTDAAEYRKEISALRASLGNLQSVLDSFQQSQQSTIQCETEHIRMELQRARHREEAACAEVNRLNGQLSDRIVLEQRAHHLDLQIQHHATQLAQLREQIEQRDSQIDALRTRLAQMAVDTDSKIDKLLIRNLLVSFFQLPSSQRSSGLRVIGSLLDFSNDDYAKVGSESGALPRLLGWVRSAVSSFPPGPPKDVTLSSTYPDKTFTELLLSFLEQESGPRAPLRLSMDHYTPDAVRPSASAQRRQVQHSAHDSRSNSPTTSSLPSTSSGFQETNLRLDQSLSSATLTQTSGTSAVPKNPLYMM
ncbi:thyroid receptor-interacting protein 11 [Clonorchis sinensis]|uniref:Thyroid receptor-interacting protein 11 n=1 Tax=Clonorchis sinensis TaxID=79923 RepID=G7YIG4_CLOSI|nr:thyroid receptor-interacting protein 11 [Clonorchis sinensis]